MSYRQKMVEELRCVGGEKECVSDDHIYAIGRLAVQWAFLEQTIKNALVKIMGAEGLYGYVALNHMPTQTLIDTFQTVISYAFAHEDHPDDMADKIIEGVRSCLTTRNLLVHSIWSEGSTPNSIRAMGIRSRGAIKPINAEFTVDQIHEAVSKTLSAGIMINWCMAMQGFTGEEARQQALESGERSLEENPEKPGPTIRKK
jgi:hypothetical protein